MFRLVPIFLAVFVLAAHAQVVISEIHYHPVELPAFDAAGNPVFQGTAIPADLTDDVHEFVEIYNAGAAPVDHTDATGDASRFYRVLTPAIP